LFLLFIIDKNDKDLESNSEAISILASQDFEMMKDFDVIEDLEFFEAMEELDDMDV
jgi:hypothetical protein